MLESFRVQNYRLFKDLKIKKLGQVNLIAGKNNSGKTALLEAIAISESEENFTNEIISAFMASRGEFLLRFDDIIEAFCDKNYPNFPDFVNTVNYGQRTIAQIGVLTLRQIINENKYYLNKNRAFDIDIKDIGKKNFEQHFSNIKNNFIFLPFDTAFDISDLWENIDLTPRKKDVIEILKTIDPKIVEVGIDARSKQAKVLLEGNNAPEPIDRFGDGVSRLFKIALCLVNAQNKTLLIDEFEVGLHHSVQKQLWEIIFKYAEKWNIQVFVTTHSQDTVENFYYVANKHKDMGQYFVLSKVENDIEAVNYDLEEMKLALETNLEMR